MLRERVLQCELSAVAKQCARCCQNHYGLGGWVLKTSKPAAGAKLRDCNQRYKREVNATKTYMRKERHVTFKLSFPTLGY